MTELEVYKFLFTTLGLCEDEIFWHKNAIFCNVEGDVASEILTKLADADESIEDIEFSDGCFLFNLGDILENMGIDPKNILEVKND